MAHGSEMAAGVSTLSGIVLGSALLHVTGMLLARHHLPAYSLRLQRLGQAIALLGGGLVLNALF